MKMSEIHIGDRLKWTDPDHPEDSGRPVTVMKKCGKTIRCVFDYIDGYGQVNAFPEELSK